MIFRVGRKTGSFFVRIVGVVDRYGNGLEQMICFKPVDFDELGSFHRILGIKTEREVANGMTGSGSGVVGNLLERYWFLGSFGADFGEDRGGCLQFVDDF